LSTPTKQDDRHQFIEVKPDYSPEPEEEIEPEDPTPDEEHPWWYWFRVELPPPKHRREFFGLICFILAAEIAVGYLIGQIIRSIFGWPF
jgi:hypothetical protein